MINIAYKEKMKDHKKESMGKQGNIPFLEKFMVPQMYELFRFGGSSVKDFGYRRRKDLPDRESDRTCRIIDCERE